MSLDTKVKNLIINTNMTKEQYEAVDDKSNQLFFVEDLSVVDVPAPEENQSGYLHTDGVNLTWKEIESSGDDYLPLSGGTLTGMLYLGEEQVGLFGENLGTLSLYKYNLINKSYYKVMEIGVNGIAPTAGKQRIGSSLQSYENVYTKSINNGADITVPTTGGTMVVATPPTDNGTYVLRATVVDGVVTTEWVSEA